MKQLKNDVKNMLKSINPGSKIVMKYGSSVIFSLFAALFITTLIYRNTEFSSGISEELILCIKQCIGGVYILPMTAEVIRSLLHIC